MRKATRNEIRRFQEQKALERKSERTGIPVSELKKPKHKAKPKVK